MGLLLSFSSLPNYIVLAISSDFTVFPQLSRLKNECNFSHGLFCFDDDTNLSYVWKETIFPSTSVLVGRANMSLSNDKNLEYLRSSYFELFKVTK